MIASADIPSPPPEKYYPRENRMALKKNFALQISDSHGVKSILGVAMTKSGVWTNGVGSYHAYGQDLTGENDPKQNPYVFESELISPYATLQPNEEYHYHFLWFATNVGAGETQIKDCSEAGIILSDLQTTIVSENDKQVELQLSGKFGVFYPGRLVLQAQDSEGKTLAEEILQQEVSPLQAVHLQNKQVTIPTTTSALKLLIRHPSLAQEKTLTGI